MMMIKITFSGREGGAIGIVYKINKTIEVLPENEAQVRSIIERFNLQKEELRTRKRIVEDQFILGELRNIPNIIDQLYDTHEHILFAGGDIVEVLPVQAHTTMKPLSEI